MTSLPRDDKVGAKVDTCDATSAVFRSDSLVSIGLPTFNRASSLRKAIESVLRQDYKDMELIISDNASSDETQTVCEEYASRDKRVRYLRQPSNCGMTANFREVLAHASGEYFMWLSDDDWLGSSYISRCVRELEDRENTVLVCGLAKYYERDVPVFEGVRVTLQQKLGSERVLSYFRQVNDNGTFYGIARSDVIRAIPLQHVLGGDWLFIAALAMRGQIVTIDDVVVGRSSRGVSADARSLALSYGISQRRARQPHLVIASNIARDIRSANASYAGLGGAARLWLATRSALIVCRRFVKIENPIRSLSRRLLARLKRAFLFERDPAPR
jgi:glycosyltransferase involved in cell wall biosynthesis